MLALQFVVLSLASYRLTRFVTTDDLPPILAMRSWILRRWNGRLELPQISVADPDWQPHQLPVSPWSEGLTCPWCIGTIISGAVVGSVAQLTSILLPGLYALAVATVVGLIGGRLDG